MAGKMFYGIRLASQQLVEPVFDRPRDLVAWMGAIQAQDYDMMKWAVGVRLKSATFRQVNEALEKGEIVRTHVMRPTWHLVAGEDIRWMRQLTAVRLKKTVDSWVKGCGLDISEALYAKCNDLIGKMLSGNKYLTREEIEVELGRAGILTADDRVRRYLLRAEMEGIVCSGGDKEGKPTYALLEEHVPLVRELQREEALVKLAINYFRSHSPASLKDFIWWSGLTVTEAKLAVGLAGNELMTEQWNSQEFYIHESCREVKTDRVLHFLPSYDEYLISYKDRCAVVAPEHQPKAFNRWGIFYPVILREGRIVGNWSKTMRKNGMILETSFFDADPGLFSKALEKAEKRYRAFRMVL